jgi:hypothetical protein
LEKVQSQEIFLELKVPKDQPNREWQNVLVVYPELPSTGIISGSRVIGALGGKIIYSKSGKISKVAEIAYLLKDKIGTPLLAAISNAGLSPKTLGITTGIFFVGLIGINIFGKITKRFKKRKHVIYPGEYRNNFNKNNFNKDW